MPDVPFDPDAAALPGAGVFGLPHTVAESACVLVPVPFDATTSYRDGARHGPEAIREASLQVDLYDLQNGRIYERGIHMLPADPRIAAANARARAAAEPLIRKGGAAAGDEDAVAVVDAAGAEIDVAVGRQVADLLAAGRLPGVVGGDHSVPLGAIRAAAAHHGSVGVLHVDAHADLRHAYEGFRYSHASIMDNVLREVPGVVRLAQVGIRDFCEEESRRIRDEGGRVVTWFDLDWRRRLLDGERFSDLCAEVAEVLPEKVWISVDIDGLDPALGPNTGTPVPGGLGFVELCLLLENLVRQERKIVGFDLVEVAPGAGSDWDANVGARVLYKLCGFALRTN
jgi:agmatinase